MVHKITFICCVEWCLVTLNDTVGLSLWGSFLQKSLVQNFQAKDTTEKVEICSSGLKNLIEEAP